MMKRQWTRYVIGAALLTTALIFLTGCKKEKAPAEVPVEAGFRSVSGAGMTFQWNIDDGIMEGILTGPTDGWVAVGFNPSDMMQGANFIIGYVENGNAEIRDDFGNRLTSHAADDSLGGTSDITLISGTESDGTTTLRFSIPVDSGDEFDGTLNMEGKNTILLAFGGSDSFTSMHRGKAKIEADFQSD